METTNTQSFWGEKKDNYAAKQLKLEGNYTIFLMSVDADYVDGDINELIDEFDSYASVHEVTEAAKNMIRTVKLPEGFMLVGMCPVGFEGQNFYGIVDFSALEAG
jgi:hypothetical protein